MSIQHRTMISDDELIVVGCIIDVAFLWVLLTGLFIHREYKDSNHRGSNPKKSTRREVDEDEASPFLGATFLGPSPESGEVPIALKLKTPSNLYTNALPV